MKRIILLSVAMVFVAMFHFSSAMADSVLHSFSGEIAFVWYGDGSSATNDYEADLQRWREAGISLQNTFGLGWMMEGLGVSVSTYVPQSLSHLYNGWWGVNPDWTSVNWTIASASNSVSQLGGLFDEISYYSSTTLVWDDYLDDQNIVDRYTVNNFGKLDKEDSFFQFEIGLWENGQDGNPPASYQYGDPSLTSISDYYPNVAGMYAGADSIRNYMTYVQNVLVEGTDEYWERTYDAVLFMRNEEQAAFMVGIDFDRNGPGPDPVPEPAAMLLLGFGLLGVSWAARRRR